MSFPLELQKLPPAGSSAIENDATPVPLKICRRALATRIVGTYTDPKHVFAYDDGEVRQEFSICFLAKMVGGDLSVSDESYEVTFHEPDQIASLPMVDSIRLRVTDYLNGQMQAIR